MRYLYWFLGLCGVSPVFSVAFALIAWTIPAPVLVLALRSVADVAVFALVLGTSVLAYGILALPLLFLGYTYGVAFFPPFAYSPLISSLRLLALWNLAAGPLSGGPCVCVGFFLWWRSCVFFLSSCSVWGRLLLSLFWCGFCASSWGACGFQRRVLPLVTLKGSATFRDPVSWPTPAVETCCWVGGVFGAPLGFLPCAVLFLQGLRFAQLPLPQLTLRGFLPFLSPGA